MWLSPSAHLPPWSRRVLLAASKRPLQGVEGPSVGGSRPFRPTGPYRLASGSGVERADVLFTLAGGSGQAGDAVAADVPLDPLPLNVRRTREAGVAARTCGHEFLFLSFSFVVSAGLMNRPIRDSLGLTAKFLQFVSRRLPLVVCRLVKNRCYDIRRIGYPGRRLHHRPGWLTVPRR